MWYQDYHQRLRDWSDLRNECLETDLVPCSEKINDWWFRAPTVNHYLHWDDQETWPGPWDLLSDDIYCELARGLGMLYTINLIENPGVVDAELVSSDQGNLVLVNGGKYILNWAPRCLLNIASQQLRINRRLNSRAITHLTS